MTCPSVNGAVGGRPGDESSLDCHSVRMNLEFDTHDRTKPRLVMLTGSRVGIGKSTLAEGLARRLEEARVTVDLFGEHQIFTRADFADVAEAFRTREFPTPERFLPTLGGRPGTGKRTLLDQFSLLVLNKELVSGHTDEWTDADIEQRSRAMVEVLCAVWPGPSIELQAAAVEAAAAPAKGDLPELPWTNEDVERLAHEAGNTLLTVLDTLSEEPGKGWRNSDFVGAGLTKWAFAALGALTVKVRNGYGRTNVPVVYTNNGGAWEWSVTADFAAKWQAARAAGGLGGAK